MVTLILHGSTELSALALTTSTRSLASAHIHRSLLQEIGRSAGSLHLASDDHICRQSVVQIVHKRILVHHKLDMSKSLLLLLLLQASLHSPTSIVFEAAAIGTVISKVTL